MPRSKGPTQRLNADQRQAQNWNLGEPSGSNVANLINDEVENYNSSEDEDFVLPEDSRAQPKRSKIKRKKSTEDQGATISKDLECLFEASELKVVVSANNLSKNENEWRCELGGFDFVLQQEIDLTDVNEYW